MIAVNPGNPTQIFEGSDGGLIRTSGQFADISAQCDSVPNGGAPLPRPSSAARRASGCCRACRPCSTTSTRSTGSTIQFINVAIRPDSDCEVIGGTQDNGTWTNTNYSARAGLRQQQSSRR